MLCTSLHNNKTTGRIVYHIFFHLIHYLHLEVLVHACNTARIYDSFYVHMLQGPCYADILQWHGHIYTCSELNVFATYQVMTFAQFSCSDTVPQVYLAYICTSQIEESFKQCIYFFNCIHVFLRPHVRSIFREAVPA